MAVVTKKSSSPPASPHRHKGRWSQAARGRRQQQHGSGGATSACDPQQGDGGRSDDMHGASLGLSRCDKNESNVPKSQLYAILTSNCNVVCLYSTVNAACLGGDRLPTLFHSKHIRTSNCYVICFDCNVNTVCVGGNRLHHIDLK